MPALGSRFKYKCFSLRTLRSSQTNAFYLEQALLVGFTKSHLIPERQLNDCYEIFFMQISNRQYGTVLESVRSGVGLYILIFALFFYITFHLLH